ncbi:MAG: SDR family oxidoreductase [Alphaproteobacteria bacterium]|nr:SDR family oxidoreductase [Alphaproteobacteria bacterium]
MARMKGKRAVITGAASGIGRASAILFAKEGASILAVDRIPDGLEETAEAITKAGGNVHAMTADVSNEADSKAIVANCVAAFGGIDAYFANAGVSGELLPITEYTVEMIERVLAVNLIGPLLAVKHAAPPMVAAGSGAIVMTASVAGIAGNAGPVVYSATKAGVINLARSAASELIGTGVRVNAICPGLIETGMTRFVFERAREKGTEDKIGQLNPLQRNGVPEEMAQVALFLASDDASYVNGHAVVADGGLSASLPFAPGSVLRAGARQTE